MLIVRDGGPWLWAGKGDGLGPHGEGPGLQG